MFGAGSAVENFKENQNQNLFNSKGSVVKWQWMFKHFSIMLYIGLFQ